MKLPSSVSHDTHSPSLAGIPCTDLSSLAEPDEFYESNKFKVSQGVIKVADSNPSCWMLFSRRGLMNSILFSPCIVSSHPGELWIWFPQLCSFSLIGFNA